MIMCIPKFIPGFFSLHTALTEDQVFAWLDDNRASLHRYLLSREMIYDEGQDDFRPTTYFTDDQPLDTHRVTLHTY